MKQFSLPVVVSYLMVYLVWGSTYFFIKRAVETIPPFYVVGMRGLLGGVAFIAIAAASGKLRRLPSVREIGSSFILGMLLLLVGNGLVSAGEQTVDSYLASLTVAASPFCVAFFNRILYKERLDPLRLAGMIMGIAGVALILYNGADIRASFTPGVCLVVAGLFSWAFATSIGHRVSVHPDSMVNSGMQLFFAGAVALAGSLIAQPDILNVASRASAGSWFGLSYLTVMGGAAFFCYSYLIKHEPSIRIVSYAIVNPLIAVVLGIVLGHEKPARFLWIGFPLVLVGLVFMLYGKRITALVKKKPLIQGVGREDLGLKSPTQVPSLEREGT